MIAERLLYFQNIESLYKKIKKVPASLSSRWENSHRDDKLKKNYLLASNRHRLASRPRLKHFLLRTLKGCSFLYTMSQNNKNSKRNRTKENMK